MRNNYQLIIRNCLFLLSFTFLFINSSIAQHDPVSGDFRSIADGTWNEFNIWEVYIEGSWQAAQVDQLPGKDNSVFLEEFTNVTLDTSAVCNNLHVHKDSYLDLDTAKLEVWGYLRFYQGNLPGTNLILPSAPPGTWISSEVDGKLIFKSSSSRSIISVGSGGVSDGLAGFNVEISFEDNSEAFLDEDFRFGNLTVSSGIFTVNSLNLFAGYSTDISGSIILKENVIFNPPSLGIYRTTSLPLESFLLDSLATLNLTTDNFIIAADNIDLSGTVIVEESAPIALNLPTNGGIPGAEIVNTYFNLYLGGVTSKNVSGNLVINGLLTLTDAEVQTNSYNLSYGEHGSLKYAGIDPVSTSDFEFPAINGPVNLIISNPNVSLHDNRTIAKQLTLNEGVLGLGNFTLTLGAESPLIMGDFSETNYIAIDGTGTLRKIFNQPGPFVFPIGERISTSEYTPATITVNSGTFNPTSYISVSLTESKHPDDISSDNYLSRFWSIASTIDDLNISGDFRYKTDDVSGMESSINTYYYDGTSEVSVGLIDYNLKSLKFASLDINTANFDISGSNHCNIEHNLITVVDQDYCESVDLDLIVGSVAEVSPLGTIEYQWETRKDEGTWTIIPGAEDKDFDPAAITEVGFYEFRRVVKTGACFLSHYSNIFSFNLFAAITNNEFNLLDIDEYCLIGSGFTFQGEKPTGGDGSYAFQWERKKNGGEFEVVGTDTSYFETDPLFPGHYEYRRGVISGPCEINYNYSMLVMVYDEITNNVVSSATLEYCDLPSEIEISGSSHSGGGFFWEYAWERKVNNGNFEPIGGNTKDLVDSDITVTGEYHYKRSISSMPCDIKNSNVFTVYVHPPLSANTINKNAEIYCGNASGYTLEGSVMSGGNGIFGYNWYRRKDNGTSTIIASSGVDYVEDDELSPGTYKYVRKVFSAACNSTSDTLVVTILPLVSNNELTTPDVVEYCGLPSEIVVGGSEPSGGDGTYSYVWERSIDEETFTEVGTGQNLTDEDISVTGKYEYQRKVSSGTCVPVVSDKVTVVIYPELSENSLSLAALNYCSDPTGFTIESVDMTGGDGSYESVWERSFDGGAYVEVKSTTAENVLGFTDSFVETETLIPGSYTYKRTVTSAVCSSNSNIIEIEVEEPLSNNILVQPEGGDAIFCGLASGLILTGSIPEGGSGVYTYKYERRLNGGEWTILNSETKDLAESNLDVPGVYDYRRIVSTSVCDEIISNEVTITITEPVVITATITGNTGLDMNGSIELEVTGGLPPYDYLWTTAEFSKNIYDLAGGEYSVAVYDQSGCEVSKTFVVPQILGLKDSENILSHKLYPNPVEESLKIEVSFLKPLPYQIYVINNIGKVVNSISSNISDKIDMKINMEDYPSGIYFVKVIADEKVETWKFIKK